MNVNFGKHLRQCRETCKEGKAKSIRDVERDGKLAKRTIERIEAGKSSPSISTLLSYANGCGLTLRDLLEPWIAVTPSETADQLAEIVRFQFKRADHARRETIEQLVRSLELKPGELREPPNRRRK